MNISQKLTEAILETFSRDNLRSFAQQWNIPRGKDKPDTLKNCVQAVMDGKARLCATVMVKPNHACENEIEQSFAVRKIYSYKPMREIKTAKGETPDYEYNKV